MKIKSEKILVNTSEVDSVGGAQPEPEERPVTEVTEVESKTRLSTGVELDKGFKTEIVRETSALELANKMSSACANCKHFDRDHWLRIKAAWDITADPFERLERDQLYGNYLADDGTLDTTGALSLKQLGVCAALSYLLGDRVIVDPFATCPPTDPNGLPMKSLFKPRSSEAERQSAARRDEILFAASKK